MPATQSGSPAWMPTNIVSMTVGYMLSRAVQVAVELGVPDHLGSGPKTVAELARLTDTDAPSLERLLLALEAFGVFSQRDSTFSLNDMSEPLRADAPGSIRNFVLCAHAPWQTQVWEETLYSIRTGAPSFQRVHGKSLFAYLAEHPEARRLFDDSMQDHTNTVVPALVAACRFAEGSRIADVGGGDGTFLIEVLRENPTCTGTLLDTPELIAVARRRKMPPEVAGRIELVAGDVFDGLHLGADIYFLKHVLHDWDDARACAILRRCREDMPSGGRVLIVEALMRPGVRRPYQRLMDLGLLLLTGGKERSEQEYRALCEASGLRLARLVPNGSPYAMFEAILPPV